jgi:hypothetical protein
MKLQNRRLRSGGSPCAQKLVIAEVLEKVHLRLVAVLVLESRSSQSLRRLMCATTTRKGARKDCFFSKSE